MTRATYALIALGWLLVAATILIPAKPRPNCNQQFREYLNSWPSDTPITQLRWECQE